MLINKQNTKYKLTLVIFLNDANNKKEQRNDRLQAGSDPDDFWLRNNMDASTAN